MKLRKAHILLITASTLAAVTAFSQPPPMPAPAPASAQPSVNGGGGKVSRKLLPPLPPSEDIVKKTAFSRFTRIDRAEVESFLAEHFSPDLLEIRAMSTREPNQAMELMTDLIQDAVKLMRMKALYPHQFAKFIQQRNLEYKANQLAEEIRYPESRNREKKEKELRKTLEGAFAAKQELMKLDLTQLEAELKKLKLLIDKRQANMKAIVDRRLEEMTEDTAFMEW